MELLGLRYASTWASQIGPMSVWVNNCRRDELERGQLIPQQRTCDDCFGMSERGQFRKSIASLDHFVGSAD
jgi:hypothetical protein